MERLDFQTTISPYKHIGDKIYFNNELQEIVKTTKTAVEKILEDCREHSFIPDSIDKERAYQLIERELEHLNYYPLKDRQICQLTDLLKDKKALLGLLKKEESTKRKKAALLVGAALIFSAFYIRHGATMIDSTKKPDYCPPPLSSSTFSNYMCTAKKIITIGMGIFEVIGAPVASCFALAHSDEKSRSPYKESIEAECERILRRVNRLSRFLETV